MAKARAKMVCAECGAEYWAEKTCYNRTEANNWEAWIQGQEGCCPACYAKRMAAKREAERAAATARAAEQSAAHNLPALTGSEKQVAWAMTIRVHALDMALAGLDGSLDNLNETGRQVLAAAMAHMPTEAKWWIDHRGEARCLALEELECACWARLTPEQRKAKMAREITFGEESRRDCERYERARLAGRGSMEQRAADKAGVQ